MAADFDPTATPTDPKTRIPLTLERVLLAAAMGAMALITAANVLTRYLSNISLAFTEEYSVALMVVVALELQMAVKVAVEVAQVDSALLQDWP
jgi:hypothetical protein